MFNQVLITRKESEAAVLDSVTAEEAITTVFSSLLDTDKGSFQSYKKSSKDTDDQMTLLSIRGKKNE